MTSNTMVNPALGADEDEEHRKPSKTFLSGLFRSQLTDTHLKVLRWAVPGLLSAIVFSYEVWEHHLELQSWPTALGARHFQWEVSLFGIFWPIIIGLLLTWLLHHWRQRTEAANTLQSLYEELTQAHIELAYADQERTALLRRQVQVLEEERHRVAAEIHDELGSMLTRLNTDLNMMRGRCHTAETEFDLQVDACRELVGQTVDRAHDICVSLRPLLLEQLGLRAALQAEARTRLAPNGLTWQVTVEGSLDCLPPDVALAAYRIAQEALTNILRHADATHVDLQLQCTCEELRLKIIDDGKGMAIAPQDPPRYSLGIIGMRERAQAVGGAVYVHNAPEQGVEVNVRLPR